MLVVIPAGLAIAVGSVVARVVETVLLVVVVPE